MTVIFSRKCELGLQAVLYLSAQKKGKFFSATEIAKQIDKQKEFVSKVLQQLTSKGIVGSQKGKYGGFYLAMDPSDIRLIDIVVAIDGHEVFENCVLGFKGCSVKTPCPVHEKWGKLRTETEKMLSSETLAELRDKTKEKLKDI